MKGGWERKRLGELLQKTGTVDPTKQPQKPFTYIDVSSVSNETFSITETSEVLGKDAPSRARRGVLTGDVIFATIRPTLKRIAIVPDELDNAVCSTGYFVLRGGAKLDNRYLFYWLFSEEFQAEMESCQKGASYPAVNDSDIRDQCIPFPPLDEQRRIVAVLDKAFANIATATANAQKNLTNARALLESYLAVIFSLDHTEASRANLSELISLQSGFAFKSSEYAESGHFLIRIGNVQDKALVLSNPRFVCLDKKTAPFALATGDIVTSLTGNIGRVAIVSEENLPAALNQRVARITLKPQAPIIRQFLYHFLTSSLFREALSSAGHGAAQQNVSPKEIGRISICYPAIELQKQICEKLDEIAVGTTALEQCYGKKLAALTELKQSLLQKAFAGELT